MPAERDRERIGLVLGGGGARGAYEVGVLSGVREVLRGAGRPLELDVLVGCSIGALNAAWLGAHAHQPDMGIEPLVEQWLRLTLEDSLRPHLRGLLSRRRGTAPAPFSLLDPRPIESLVGRIPWTQLHYNLASSRLSALVVTALNIATGRTTVFVQVAPEASYRASRGDPRRNAMLVRMRAEHVLASAAFPWLFPPRRIDGAYYCDGGLRLNTPLAPALRAGCDRLLVVSLLSRPSTQDGPVEPAAPRTSLERERVQAFHSPVFLFGKLLDALLLDSIDYDLSVLERFNRLVEVLECQLDPDQMEHVRAVLTRARGTPYRCVPALRFAPSRDLGGIAAEFLERNPRRSLSAWLLKTLRRLSHTREADLMSFLLLDGEFARELIELGRSDVRARADEVLQFFSRQGCES